MASPHDSPGFVASRFHGASCVGFATEERAGVVVHCVERSDRARTAQGVPWAGTVELLENHAG